MAAIAQLKSLLGMDSKNFEAGTRKSEKAAKRLQGELKAVGRTIAAAFSVGAIVAATRSVIAFASEIRHTADNLGITTDELQGLNDVALEFGLSTENIRDRLSKLVVVQGRAAEGQVAYLKALDQLNISHDDFINASPAEAFELLATGVANAKSEQEALSALSKIYSEENAPRLVAMLKKIGNEGLQTIIDKSKEAGRSLDEDLITKLESLGTANEKIMLRLKVGWAQVLGVVGNAVTRAGAFYGELQGQLDEIGAGRSLLDRFWTLQKMRIRDFDFDKAEAAGDAAVGVKPPPVKDFVPPAHGWLGNWNWPDERSRESKPFKPDSDAKSLTDRAMKIIEQAEKRKAQGKLTKRVEDIFANAIAGVRDAELNVGGSGTRVSGLQGVGGVVGESRTVNIADRQLRLQIEAARRQERIEELEQKMLEKLGEIEDKLPGVGIT